MANAAIPTWNVQGIIPPIHTTNPTSTDRSPYEVVLTDLVLHFGTTPQRQAILHGFLTFRAMLYSAGLTDGFQWIDGSFLENIELIENREPGDVDVVTFFNMPEGRTQQNLFGLHPRLFNPVHTKKDHHVDAYFIQMNKVAPEPLIRLSTYWYSMWSHRRNGLWKGFLQVSLSQGEDMVAIANLDHTRQQVTHP